MEIRDWSPAFLADPHICSHIYENGTRYSPYLQALLSLIGIPSA